MMIPKEDTKARAFEVASEHLAALLRLESNHYLPLFDRHPCGSINPQSPSFSRHRERDEWRHKICDWFYQIVDQTGYDREVVLFALSYMDRVVTVISKASTVICSARDYRLVAITSLYMAIKLHGQAEHHHYRRALPVQTIVDLARDPMPPHTVERMELFILETLQWHINTPTSLSFCEWMIRLFPDSSPHLPAKVGRKIYQDARFLCELASYHFDLSMYYPASTIAYVAIVCVMDARGHHDADDGALFVSFETRAEFLLSLADLVQLTPNTPSVVECLPILKDLAPARWFLAPHTMSPSSSVDHPRDQTPAKKPKEKTRAVASPVGVADYHDARFCCDEAIPNPTARCLY